MLSEENTERNIYLLEVAFDADWEDRNVVHVLHGFVDKASVDDLLVCSQVFGTHVAGHKVVGESLLEIQLFLSCFVRFLIEIIDLLGGCCSQPGLLECSESILDRPCWLAWLASYATRSRLEAHIRVLINRAFICSGAFCSVLIFVLLSKCI